MCTSFSQSRAKLISLIYAMNRFTEKELTEKYYGGEKNGNYETISVGGLHSVRSYLNDLTQFGTLRYDRGYYQVAQYGENRYA